MDDASLCQLIREALHSPERAEALAHAIDHLPEVKRYLGQGWLPYYDKALPVTMRDVQRNINRFPQMYRLKLESVNCQNPSEAANVRKCFINWVMIILKRDCYDVKRGRKPIIVSIKNPIAGDDGLTMEETIADDLTLTGIERLLEEERLFLGRTIKRYIEEDPEMRLRNCYMRDRPDINCQVLLQKRFLQNCPLTLKEIANELQTKVPNIQSRLERNCLPLLIEITTTLGYK